MLPQPGPAIGADPFGQTAELPDESSQRMIDGGQGTIVGGVERDTEFLEGTADIVGAVPITRLGSGQTGRVGGESIHPFFDLGQFGFGRLGLPGPGGGIDRDRATPGDPGQSPHLQFGDGGHPCLGQLGFSAFRQGEQDLGIGRGVGQLGRGE